MYVNLDNYRSLFSRHTFSGLVLRLQGLTYSRIRGHYLHIWKYVCEKCEICTLLYGTLQADSVFGHEKQVSPVHIRSSTQFPSLNPIQPIVAASAQRLPNAYEILYEDFNTRCYTVVHVFCFFKLFL